MKRLPSILALGFVGIIRTLIFISAFLAGMYTCLLLSSGDINTFLVLATCIVMFILWIAIYSTMGSRGTSSRPSQKISIIYMLAREDGIVKIGRTSNLKARVSQHERDYKLRYNIISAWAVPDNEVINAEKVALEMTQEFSYKENGRRELRAMSQSNIDDFIIKFTREAQRISETRQT